MSKKVQLDIDTIAPSVTQNHSYTVILSEVEGDMKLPIVIGSSEAQSIAMALENMQPPRPLTHDLLKNIMGELQASITEVIITAVREGVFYAELHCEVNGTPLVVDSRSSDALAMAIRFSCPIYTYADVLDKVGVAGPESRSEKTKTEDKEEKSGLSQYSLDDLNRLLTKAVENENYDEAAKIRDEIQKRK